MALQLDLPVQAAEPQAQSSDWKKLLTAGRKVTLKDRLFFTEQLALLLDTGTPLHPALATIAGQMADTPMHSIVQEMTEGVLNGNSLSEELGKHPELFSSMYVSLVAASEGGGFLPEVLEQLRNTEEQNDRLRATLVSAFTYPAFLVLFSIFTLIFVLVVVFPKFGELFTAIGDQLPTSTKVLMAISQALIDHWMAIIAGLAVAVLAAGFWLGSEAGRSKIDHGKLSYPGLRGIWRRVYVVLLLRVLGLSLQHGVSLVDAVRSSHGVVENRFVRRFLEYVGESLEQGGRLAQCFTAAPWMPQLTKQMLTTAEEAGSLAPVMLRLSDYYTRELERSLERFSKMIEPIMLLVMGALVGLLVSSMLLPIFKLSSAVA